MDKIKVHSSLLGNPAVRRKLSQKKLTPLCKLEKSVNQFEDHTKRKTEERKPSIRKKKPMARPEKDGVAINCLSNPNLAPAMARNMFSLFHF